MVPTTTTLLTDPSVPEAVAPGLSGTGDRPVLPPHGNFNDPSLDHWQDYRLGTSKPPGWVWREGGRFAALSFYPARAERCPGGRLPLDVVVLPLVGRRLGVLAQGEEAEGMTDARRQRGSQRR